MKKFLSAALALCLAFSLAACGGSGSSAPASASVAGSTGSSAPEAKPVEIRVVTSYGGDDGNRANYEEAVAGYEAATGNTVVDESATSNEQWKAQVKADFQTGSEPDVLFFFTGTDASEFIKNGKVVSIEEIRKEYPDYASNMLDAAMPLSFVDAKAYAVPSSGYWEGMFVNKTVLADCGLEVPGPETMRKFVGPPLGETFIQFGIPADKVDEAIAVYRSRYMTVGKYENFPYPGVREMLEALKNDGKRLFVATSKPETTSVDILRHFELDQYFEIIAGASLDGKRGSKSQVLSYLLERANGQTDGIMVGDTVFDILGAKALGIPAVGVSWGYGDVAEMNAAGAVAMMDSPAELTAFLLK